MCRHFQTTSLNRTQTKDFLQTYLIWESQLNLTVWTNPRVFNEKHSISNDWKFPKYGRKNRRSIGRCSNFHNYYLPQNQWSINIDQGEIVSLKTAKLSVYEILKALQTNAPYMCFTCSTRTRHHKFILPILQFLVISFLIQWASLITTYCSILCLCSTSLCF